MKRRRLLFAAAIAQIGAASWSGCASSVPPTPSPPVTVTSVAVTGLSGALTAGQTKQLTATATLSDATTENVTAQAAWQSSNAAVLTVSPAGLATLVGAGEADVRASFNNVSGIAHATVALPTVPLYSLSGVISSSAGGPLSDAQVVVLDGVDAGRSTTTDAAGRYLMENLTRGGFTIEISKSDFQTARRPVTLTGDIHLDVVLNAAPPPPPISSYYGTYNVSISVTRQTCDFPVTPDPNGQVVLEGNPDGSNFRATITERGDSRTYPGTINPDGTFIGNRAGLLPGAVGRPLPRAVVSRPRHDASGTLSGRVSGVNISGSEDLTFGAPCPDKVISIGFSGSK